MSRKPAGGPDLADGFGADVNSRGELSHADETAFGRGADSAQSGRGLIECRGSSRPAFDCVFAQPLVRLSNFIDHGCIALGVSRDDYRNCALSHFQFKRSKVALAACALPWASAGPPMLMVVSVVGISWQQLGHFVKATWK